MLEKLVNTDRYLFRLINGANDPVLDFVMYWATDKWVWIPFYAWLLYILIRQFGKKTIYIIVFTVVLITLSDQISVLIKNEVQRLRPCHDPYFSEIIHLVN